MASGVSPFHQMGAGRETYRKLARLGGGGNGDGALGAGNSQLPIMSADIAEVEKASKAANARKLRLVCVIIFSRFFSLDTEHTPKRGRGYRG